MPRTRRNNHNNKSRRDPRKSTDMPLEDRKLAMQRCISKLNALYASGLSSTKDAKCTRHAAFMFAGPEMWSQLSFARPNHFIDWIDDLT